jgi:hypothetical protein
VPILTFTSTLRREKPNFRSAIVLDATASLLHPRAQALQLRRGPSASVIIRRATFIPRSCVTRTLRFQHAPVNMTDVAEETKRSSIEKRPVKEASAFERLPDEIIEQ